ncbi:hypothetical protein H0H92_002791 [Tricholoma furcatifolium]|nr:hypothetical protein H0H92_002791 [Tricholoma furcatifolium]
MPPRTSARAQPRPMSPPAAPTPKQPTQSEPIAQLRTNWKWAAFSQFFFTFNHLFNMSDVSLDAIEEDLIHDTNVVLPRIMQRLLYTLSYDRKVSLSNWQTALRKQYRKRDPAANPIGPEPRVEGPEQESSPPPEEQEEHPEEHNDHSKIEETEGIEIRLNGEADVDEENRIPDSTRASTIERGFSLEASTKGVSVQPSEIDSIHLKQSSVLEEEGETKDWMDLPMLTKLDSMHLLTEWQFHNATRVRTLMRSDDENASWRAIPKPPRPKTAASKGASLKRKRAAAPPAKKVSKGKSRAAPAPAAKRARITEPVATTGRSRAAKSQAKAKLDAQAKELAELNRQANAQARSSSGLRTSSRVSGSPKKGSPKKPPPPPRATGVRSSRRLRGDEEEDEWQSVPEEWLNDDEESKPSKGTKAKASRAKESEKTGLEDGDSDISELTELSEDSEEEKDDEDQDGGDGEDEGEGGDEDEQQEEESHQVKEEVVQSLPETPAEPVDRQKLQEQPVLPEGFIEWETICVTLYEWEHIAERFEKATHYTEKSLYKVLVNTIVPVITEELRELERKKKLATAITQRKRSSRLLIRQTEKEEAEAVERRRREELERTSRARRQEARAKKEEDAREQREIAREMRRREREEKEGAESEKLENVNEAGATPGEGSEVDVVGNRDVDDVTTKKQPTRGGRRAAGDPRAQNGRAGGSGSKTPVGEEWELDCEICHRRGINLDDGTPMMSCGLCSKWQHIACHDRADQQAGRRRRNWDTAEFFCLQCRAKRAGVTRSPAAPHYQQQCPSMSPMHAGSPSAHLQQNPYMSLATQYANPNYVPYGSVNGSTSYSRVAPQTSDARSGGASPRSMPHGQSGHRQHQAYGAPLTFSHYQPQQRGFSSTTEPIYGTSPHTQPYGYPSSQSPYPQYPPMNGGGQHYQPTSQGRWAASNNISSQRSTSEQNFAPAAHLPYHANGDRAIGSQTAHDAPPMASSRQWQQPPLQHHPQSSPSSGVATQHEFRHYTDGTSYPQGPP